MRDIKVLVVGVSVAAGLLAAGCKSSSSTEHHLSGKVTFKGQPLAAGKIFFLPKHFSGPECGALKRLHWRDTYVRQHLHLVMQAEARDDPGDPSIGRRENLAAGI